jgi:hypothetical protein
MSIDGCFAPRKAVGHIGGEEDVVLLLGMTIKFISTDICPNYHRFDG